MGTIKQGAFTGRSVHAILLVGLFSFLYVGLFLWDNDVIQEFLKSKKPMKKYGRRYSFSKAMSNDDFNDSFSIAGVLRPNEKAAEDSIIFYPKEQVFMNISLTNTTAISGTVELVDVRNNDSGHVENTALSKESLLGENNELFHEPQVTINGNRNSEVKLSPQTFNKQIQSSARKRVQIVIVTTKRSGSSFIGELFNSNPDIFYMYEPLFQVTFDVLKHSITTRQAESMISTIWNHTLRCNYSNFNQKPQNWLKRGGLSTCKVSDAVNSSNLLCPVRKIPVGDVERVISKLCSERPFTVLKTIRVMDIKDLRVFLEDPSLNLKIIHLVRDPRAVMNSRRKLKEPNYDLLRRKGHNADEVEDLCQHMAQNLKYRNDPPSWLKGKYMLVRFEDVAQDPVEQAKRIYQHLGIKMHQDVISWLKKNTHGNVGQKDSPFSRTRDTVKVINAWKDSISKEMRKEVESKCNLVMNALSYRLMV